MTARTTYFLLAFASSCASLPAPAPQQTDSRDKANRVLLYAGRRDLQDSDYEPVDEQGTIGLGYVRERQGAAIGWELGVFGSRSEEDVAGGEDQATSTELYGGVHKSFGADVVRPYVGGGLALIRTELDPAGAGSEDGGSLAGYAHGGVDVEVAASFFIGLDLRFLFGSDIEYSTSNTDGDYGQLAITLGFAF